MFGRLGKAGWATILVAAGLVLGTSVPAQAADLGGDCCGDLEERIAELEATTARKGNRKVSLEVSGHVNEAFLWYDDGVETDGGVYTNDNARTRFRFKGDAKIADGWKAGFLIEIGVRGDNSKRFDQENANGCIAPVSPKTFQTTACGLDLRHSVWYIDSKKYGRVWVGLTGGAGESVTEVNLAASKDVLKYSDIEDTGLGLFTRTANGTRLATRSSTGGRSGLEWRQLIRGGGDQPGEGRRWNMVRYDTPELFGFTGTVNWGEDDAWEIGLRFKEDKFHGFKLAAAIAYGENTEGPQDAFNADPQPAFQCLGNNLDGVSVGPNPAGRPDTRCSQLGGSISVMHEKAGIYGNLAAGYTQDDALNTDPGFKPTRPDDRSSFYAFELGVERKWEHLEHLGKTTIFGQYYRNDGGSQDRTVTTVNNGFSWNDTTATSDISGGNGFENGDLQSSTLESYGLGVIQGIDKAAMHVYVVYRHYEGDILTTGGTTFELDDLDVAMSGAIIKF